MFKLKKKEEDKKPNFFSKLSFKSKIIFITIIVLASIIILILFFIVFDDIASNIVIKRKENKYDGKKPGYAEEENIKVDKESTDSGSGNTVQDFEDAGLTVDEARIIYALERILGGLTDETVKRYMNLPNPMYRATTIRTLLPGVINESIEYGILASLSMGQSISELGWMNPNNFPKAFRYKNAYGIKAYGKPNQYWDGSYENVNTHEGYGSGQVSIRDKFRSYKSFWHSSMDHGLFLQKPHYVKHDVIGSRTPEEFARRLHAGGYYTDSVSNYTKKLVGVVNTNNLTKLDELVIEVKKALISAGGGQSTPGGTQIPDDEWKPGNKIYVGPFLMPDEHGFSNTSSSDFGPRNTGIPGASKFHAGIDIQRPPANSQGVRISPDIKSVADGEVVDARVMNGYGNCVTVKHSDNFFTRYAHLANLKVKKGDIIARGTVVGKMGSTGVGSGIHLHFEVRTQNAFGRTAAIDPLTSYFERADYKGRKVVVPKGMNPNNPNDYLNKLGSQDGSINPNTNPYKDINQDSLTFATEDLYRGMSWAKEWDIPLSHLSKKRFALIYEGNLHLGKAYQWGANGPNTFDCSGFTSWVYKHGVGITIPRTSELQAKSSLFRECSIDDAMPGDLFWKPGHIGLFLKDYDGKSIIAMHAPRTGDVVKVAKYPKVTEGHTVKYFKLK